MYYVWAVLYYRLFCTLAFFFFKQKTAYEMRISDCSSDVCSSDLSGRSWPLPIVEGCPPRARAGCIPFCECVANAISKVDVFPQIGSASCRERVCQYV